MLAGRVAEDARSEGSAGRPVRAKVSGDEYLRGGDPSDGL